LRSPSKQRAEARVVVPLLLAWALLGGGSGCLGPPLPPPGCLGNPSLEPGVPGSWDYTYTVPNHTVDARGVDWVGQPADGVELEGAGSGCFVGGRVEGTWNPNDLWDLYHHRKALPVELGGRPLIVEKLHVLNFGDAVSLEADTPCPNGSPSWLVLRDSLLEDVHDDAVESDGLCSAEVIGNLLDRTYVAFAFRSREDEPYRNGSSNTVTVRNNLVRMHAFAHNYAGQPGHRGVWKWARDGRGPKIVVRGNRFLTFDAPLGGTLLPFVNEVVGCSDNVLLFAGDEAEWQQALAGGCDDAGNDALCDGERLLALASCFTAIAKPDTQSEADFLATHWDPHVASWKASRSADDE
jgi:hypothetical protein